MTPVFEIIKQYSVTINLRSITETDRCRRKCRRNEKIWNVKGPPRWNATRKKQKYIYYCRSQSINVCTSRSVIQYLRIMAMLVSTNQIAALVKC